MYHGGRYYLDEGLRNLGEEMGMDIPPDGAVERWWVWVRDQESELGPEDDPADLERAFRRILIETVREDLEEAAKAGE